MLFMPAPKSKQIKLPVFNYLSTVQMSVMKLHVKGMS